MVHPNCPPGAPDLPWSGPLLQSATHALGIAPSSPTFTPLPEASVFLWRPRANTSDQMITTDDLPSLSLPRDDTLAHENKLPCQARRRRCSPQVLEGDVASQTNNNIESGSHHHYGTNPKRTHPIPRGTPTSYLIPHASYLVPLSACGLCTCRPRSEPSGKVAYLTHRKKKVVPRHRLLHTSPYQESSQGPRGPCHRHTVYPKLSSVTRSFGHSASTSLCFHKHQRKVPTIAGDLVQCISVQLSFA